MNETLRKKKQNMDNHREIGDSENLTLAFQFAFPSDVVGHFSVLTGRHACVMTGTTLPMIRPVLGGSVVDNPESVLVGEDLEVLV